MYGQKPPKNAKNEKKSKVAFWPGSFLLRLLCFFLFPELVSNFKFPFEVIVHFAFEILDCGGLGGQGEIFSEVDFWHRLALRNMLPSPVLLCSFLFPALVSNFQVSFKIRVPVGFDI